MAPSLRFAKYESLRKLGVGLLLILVGIFAAKTPYFLLGPVMVAIGVYLAGSSFTRLIRLVARDNLIRGSWSLHEHFAQSSLPRKVFWLLLAIAEVDGRAEAREQEMVRRFLMERFVDPVTAQDLRSWEAQRIPTDQVVPLAQRLRATLSQAECDTVFYWGCLVAFADGSFKPDEHRVLQSVAQAFGFPKDHAWRIFHHAKQRYLAQETSGDGRDDSRARSWRQVDERTRAHEVLGLEPDASPARIRSRHRELVKRHHPDAHAHLGPVAAQEATERFREIQAAYELLTDGK